MQDRRHRVLLTRTEPGATRQADALSAAGLQPVKLPLLKIEPVPCEVPGEIPDVVIVLSAHAVAHGANIIEAWGDGANWLAVGKATARALAEVGIHAISPARESSEGILASEALAALQDRRVGVVCGESPRPLLRETLIDRGAHLIECPVYRRLPVRRNSDYHAHLANLSAVVLSSAEGLRVFADLWNDFCREKSVMLCVKSERIADLARRLGFKDVRTSTGTTGMALAHELAGWILQAEKGKKS